jgi:hypothetical protein
MRRQQQQQLPDPAFQPQPPPAPSAGILTQADPTSLADRATAAALGRPGVSGFSVTANPGAPSVGSVSANLGQPSPYSALQLGTQPGMTGGIGDVFARAAQLQAGLGAPSPAPTSGDLVAQRALQARLLGSDGGGSSAPQYYSGG